MGQEGGRQTFMKLHKMENGPAAQDERMALIMTPMQANAADKRLSDLDLSKGDIGNNSHYHRFKRNSLGY